MISLLYVFLILGATMASLDNGPCSVEEFFPDVKGNLTKVTWAHAVNSKLLLSEALNSSVMMLEADIVLGKLINSTAEDDEIPIMGHPPATTSDLSLEQFLTSILQFNNKTENATNRKGVKLDFKTIEVFEKSLSFITRLYHSMNYPVWINADILAGPLGATAKPVDPRRFFEGAKNYTQSALSIGWTTRYIPTASYADKHINEMLGVIKENNVKQSITFPVRAALVAESLKQMKTLVDAVSNSTLTIWSSSSLDLVNVSKLREVIRTVGLARVYIDVPEKLLNDLHLETI